ncbi:hypothetical protein G3A_01965 [Bacillus sp. 17376]|nr:hypothetical protein G3A_01965 [Bacillus sp. 17376]
MTEKQMLGTKSDQSNNPQSIRNRTRFILLKPLLVAEIYFIFTLILYTFGPTTWINTNPYFLYAFLILYQLFFSFGYLYEINKARIPIGLDSKKENLITSNRIKIKRFVKFIIIFGLIMTSISTITYTNISTFSLSALIDQTINGITNPLSAYKESFGGGSEGGIIYLIIVLTSPITWAAFPLSVVYFKRLNLSYKVIVIIMFSLEAMRWIIMGRNKGVFDLAIIIISIILIRKMQNKYENINNEVFKKRKAKGKKNILLILILLTLCISYFTNAIGDRTNNHSYYSVNMDAPLMKISPEFLHPTLIYLTSYLTQGYYAFSRIIELQWTPMFGIGNSMFLMSNFSDLFNNDMFQYTYQSKLALKGIDPMSAWHSFYTWIANDVHWIGVLIIMFLLGRFFAFVVKKCVVEKEIIAYPLLCLMFILIFYLPGNNQVFSQPVTFMAFWVLSLYWIMIKKRIVFTRSVWGMADK